MILDKLCEFDPANTAITASAASTNTLDMGANRDLGVGNDILVYTAIQQTFAAAGAATLTIQLQGSQDNSTWVTLGQSDALPKANLTAGSKVVTKIAPTPPQGAGPSRYYRLNYVVGTGPFTAGQLQSDIVGSESYANNFAYPAGFSVTN